MAGIRIINAPPETFRFPEWRDDIFYAADSVVRYASFMNINDSDSDIRTRFYIALKDVPPGTGIPKTRLDLWGEVAASAVAVGQVVSQIIDNDSDILWLRQKIPHIQLERDSDVGVIRADHDSDHEMTYHDFRAADSDITAKYDSEVAWLRNRIIGMEIEEDSDNKITRDDHDSDIKMTYHDFKADDSDMRDYIDSDIAMLRHDFEAEDSDINAILFAPYWDAGTF